MKGFFILENIKSVNTNSKKKARYCTNVDCSGSNYGLFRELKYQPKSFTKNISEKALDNIMNGFKVSSGVKCNFHHVPQAGNIKRIDFASDEKFKK
ncbi:MAG: hypothetical protein ACOH2A_07080 [Sphingobacteriaceae bacterium]